MTKEEESALVGRLKQGDARAQRGFFEFFFEPLINWLRINGARQMADIEEIVRETFLRAFRAIGQFRHEASLKTWLFKLASNALKDYYKSPKHSPVQTGTDIGDFDESWIPGDGAYQKSKTDSLSGNSRTTLPPFKKNDFESLLREERRQKLLVALDRLSPAHRQVLHLRLVEQLSIEATADIMGRSRPAVKQLQLRAGEAFKAIVEQDPYFNDGTSSKEVSH